VINARTINFNFANAEIALEVSHIVIRVP
jgi:hypothetical protein